MLQFVKAWPGTMAPDENGPLGPLPSLSPAPFLSHPPFTPPAHPPLRFQLGEEVQSAFIATVNSSVTKVVRGVLLTRPGYEEKVAAAGSLQVCDSLLSCLLLGLAWRSGR